MYDYEHQNIVDSIKTIETKFAVHELVYKDIEIWPLVKADFNIQLIRNSYPSNDELTIETKNTLKKRIGNIILAYQNYRDLKTKHELLPLKLKELKLALSNKKNNNLFLTFTSFRNQKINERYFNVQSDSFLCSLRKPHKLTTIEFTQNNNNNSPYYSESINLDVLRDLAEIKCAKDKLIKYCKALLLKSKTNRGKALKKEEFNNFIKKEKLALKYNIDDYIFELKMIIKLKEIYTEYLSPIQPKFIATPVYFAHESFAATLFCKEQKIPSIEIQHGAYSQPIYEFHCEIPKNNFKILPDFYLSWDQNQADIINNWSNKSIGKKAHVLGITPLKFWLKNSDQFTNENLKNIEPLLSNHELIHVLYTISDTFDEKIPNMIAQTKGKVFWYLRNHPRALELNAPFVSELIDNLNKNKCTNYDMVNSTKAPLYSLLNKVDYHLTSISSVVCEAKELGIKSIVINSSGVQLYKDIYPNHAYILFETQADKIVKIISDKPQLKRINPSINSLYFEDLFHQITSENN